MPTAHINAESTDFAPAVLMPGDPKRAQRIAEQLLDSPKKVTDVRGMLGFTGTYQGQPLSVMGSGMGQPSIGIYANELYKFFGVQRIIRVGTCGGISADVHVGDIVLAAGAHTDSNFNQARIPGIYFSAIASANLLIAAAAAHTNETPLHIGTIVSRDHFYASTPGQNEGLADYGVLGVEMETAALYGIAAQYHTEALTVLTVSDHLFDDTYEMTASERESTFQGALKLAVAAALV
ncbi:purine-nucleoside phosphorylase [Actinomycetaceae bacterium WB03_NA08]|uniref:Uridine phosphorylase n=1 Tax=Scrofimicrobium canadense TaxID=2652290 RepID=A0A6N7W9C0_9ACTO|nr:purine-nucleoside phosphorylase [Scrofimicrobium canadense]MSS84856.1 purine-nucleoside phosphorylase [Scrofimicrobium canadense]